MQTTSQMSVEKITILLINFITTSFGEDDDTLVLDLTKLKCTMEKTRCK